MVEIKAKGEKKELKNWVLPGISLNQDELLEGIQKAENGPFFTIHESMEHFEQWMVLREKK